MSMTMSRSELAPKFGMAGLYVLAFSAWTFTAGVDIGLVLMLIGTLLQPKLYPVIWRQGVGPMLVLIAVYLIASGVWASIEFPASASQQSTAVYRWSKLLLFFLPAWWLCQDTRAPARVYWFSLIGFLAMLLLNADWLNLWTLNITLDRSGFGLRDPNETALPCCVYLFSLGLFANRLTHTQNPWIKLGLGSLTFWILAFVLISTLSRQAWLALAVVGVPLVLLNIGVWLRTHSKAKFAQFVSLLAIPFLIVLILLMNNFASIHARFAEEKVETSTLLDSNKIDSYTSVAMRINMLKFGIEKWRERPILGWGIGSTKYIAASSQDPRMLREDPKLGERKYFANVHNSYVETLFRMGLLGVLIWLGLFLVMMRMLIVEYRSNLIPLDIFLFLIGLGLIMLVIDWFSFYVGNNRGCVYWLLLAGTIYSGKLKRKTLSQ